MTNSRKIIYLQWGIIAVLLLLLWFRPSIPCPDIPPSSHTEYITYHDTVLIRDTVKPTPTGIRRRIREQYTPPERPIAVLDCVKTPIAEVDSFCDEYFASKQDSSVDIYVMYCTPRPAQDVVISYRLKGIKSIHTIDSIPYKVGFDRALYAGASLNTGGGISAEAMFYTPKRTYSYGYDLLLRQHRLGVGFRIWGK